MAVIAVIWSFGTWFYASRLFSLAAFIALAVSVVRLGEFLEAELELYLVLLSFVGLVGLGGVFVLRRWRSTNFSLPLFILIQVSQIGLVTFALVTIVVRLDDLPSRWTLLSTLFWLLAMAFYVLSDLIFPFVLFPWLSVAALYPLPLNFMLSFDVEPLQVAMATWFWGLLLALTSEIFSRFQADKLNRYRLPSLAGSGFVILTAIFIAYFEDISYGFAFLLGSSILYVLLHLLKPRAYVWTAALLLGLGAYFSFFALPLMESIDFFVGFQLLGVSLLLLGPDLFFDPDFFANKTLRWPLRILGAVMAFLNLVWLLSSSTAHFGEAAVCYSIYAIFFALYALKFNRAWLGYIATLSAAIAVGFAILHFEPDAWMLTLTALAAIYYISGFTLGRGGYQSTWSDMLRYSGLGLTSLVSIWAIIILEKSGGWYVLIAALAFGIELFTRRVGWAEAGLQGFLASGVYLLLQEADLDRGYQGLGIALALLGTDLVLGQIYAQKRTLAWVSRGVGALVVILNTLVLFFGDSDPLVGAICFGMYMLFFLAQTLLYRQPVLGYGFSLFSVLTVIFTLQTFDQPKWILPVTLLAALYYAAGYFLRKKPINKRRTIRKNSQVCQQIL